MNRRIAPEQAPPRIIRAGKIPINTFITAEYTDDTKWLVENEYFKTTCGSGAEEIHVSTVVLEKTEVIFRDLGPELRVCISHRIQHQGTSIVA